MIVAVAAENLAKLIGNLMELGIGYLRKMFFQCKHSFCPAKKLLPSR